MQSKVMNTAGVSHQILLVLIVDVRSAFHNVVYSNVPYLLLNPGVFAIGIVVGFWCHFSFETMGFLIQYQFNRTLSSDVQSFSSL